MKHYAGLDVSVKETAICIVDENGRICREAKVVSHPEDLSKALTGTGFRIERIGLEAGPLSQWLFEGMARAGLSKYKEWKFDWEPKFLEMTRDFIFPNTFATIEYALKTLGDGHGTKFEFEFEFEFECYDLSHHYSIKWFIDQGLIKPPFFIQIVFGILGGVGADLDNLMHMHKVADQLFGPENYEWSVLAAGRHQMPFATQSALLGGNLRVGLEDSLFIGKGKLATSNAQQVRRIRTIIESLGLTVATPAEARPRLGLKDADKVAF